MKACLGAFGVCMCVALCAGSSLAQSESDSVGAALSALDWKKGPTTAKVGDVASQEVGSGLAFLEGAEARKFLELGQNPASPSDIGVIMSDNWWASYSYDDIGYVRDDEKGSLDCNAILASFKKGVEHDNAERRKHGWPELTILGWAREPHYDEVTHNLEWALKISSTDGVCVNYNTRILGRGGVMRVTLVCDPDKLQSVLPEFKSTLQGFSYNAGSRYGEYRKGDRTAEIGLSALILGGATVAATKTGVFKWLWKCLVAAAVAIGGVFKKLFGKDRQDQ